MLVGRHTGRYVTGEVNRWVCMLVGRLLGRYLGRPVAG